MIQNFVYKYIFEIDSSYFYNISPFTQVFSENIITSKLYQILLYKIDLLNQDKKKKRQLVNYVFSPNIACLFLQVWLLRG